MTYAIKIRPSAFRDLERLPPDARARVAARIDRLGREPRPPDCRELRALENCYRARVGPYRILYTVTDEVITVTVVRVRHRREAYGR